MPLDPNKKTYQIMAPRPGRRDGPGSRWEFFFTGFEISADTRQSLIMAALSFLAGQLEELNKEET